MRHKEENAQFPAGLKFGIYSAGGKLQEGFVYKENAEHALDVLNDHEEQNGRGRPYHIEERKP